MLATGALAQQQVETQRQAKASEETQVQKDEARDFSVSDESFNHLVNKAIHLALSSSSKSVGSLIYQAKKTQSQEVAKMTSSVVKAVKQLLDKERREARSQHEAVTEAATAHDRRPRASPVVTDRAGTVDDNTVSTITESIQTYVREMGIKLFQGLKIQTEIIERTTAERKLVEDELKEKLQKQAKEIEELKVMITEKFKERQKEHQDTLEALDDMNGNLELVYDNTEASKKEVDNLVEQVRKLPESINSSSNDTGLSKGKNKRSGGTLSPAGGAFKKIKPIHATDELQLTTAFNQTTMGRGVTDISSGSTTSMLEEGSKKQRTSFSTFDELINSLQK